MGRSSIIDDKIPSDEILESLYKLRIRGSEKLKTVLELYDLDIHQKKSNPDYHKLKTMVIRNYDYETLTPGTGKMKQEQWSRVDRDQVASKEEKVLVISGKKKAKVRRETSAVSGMRVMIVHQNQNTLPPHFLSQRHHEVEVCRGREVSEAKVTVGPFFDNRADII